MIKRIFRSSFNVLLSLTLLIPFFPVAAVQNENPQNALSAWITLADELVAEKRNYISGEEDFLEALNRAKQGNADADTLIAELKSAWTALVYTVRTQIQTPLEAVKNNLGVASLGSHYTRKIGVQPQFEWQLGARNVSYWENVISVDFYMNGYQTSEPAKEVSPNWGVFSVRLSDDTYAELESDDGKYNFYQTNGSITRSLKKITVSGEYFRSSLTSGGKSIDALIFRLGDGSIVQNTLTVGSLFITRSYSELLPAEPAVTDVQSGTVRYGTICTVNVPSGTTAYYTIDGTVPTVYSEHIADGQKLTITKPSLKILSAADGCADAVISYDFTLTNADRSELIERISELVEDVTVYEQLGDIRLAAQAALIPQGTQSDEDYMDFCNLCDSFAALSGEHLTRRELLDFLSATAPGTDFSNRTDTEIIRNITEWDISALSEELQKEREIICKFLRCAQTVTVGGTEHGMLLIDNAFASAGENVTVQVCPDEGYRLKIGTLLVYTDGMATVVPQRCGWRNNTAYCDSFEFTMPDSNNVSVSAVFEKKDSSPVGHIGRAKREHYSGETDALRVINRCYLNGDTVAFGIILVSEEMFLNSGAADLDLNYSGKMTRIDSRDEDFVLYDRCLEYVDFSATVVYATNSPNKKKNIISRAYAINRDGSVSYSELLICSFNDPSNICLSSNRLIYGDPAGYAGHILAVSTVENCVTANEKTELKLNISDSFENPYDADEVSLNAILTGPNGEKCEIFGFYMEDYNLHDDGNIVLNGGSQWRFRFSLPTGGLWRYSIALTAGETVFDTVSGCIEVSENMNGDRSVRVSATDTTRFALANGAAYTPLGFNVCWQRNFAEYAEYVNAIADNGGNYMRIWLSQLGLSLMKQENAPDDFSGGAADAAALDVLIELCEERGVYLQIALFYHGALRASGTDAAWLDNPFSDFRNGYLSSPDAFWTNTQAREDTKNYIRYMLARWGYSRSIFSWELCNEITSAAGNASDIKAWCEEMTEYLRENDPYMHMVSVSTASPDDAFIVNDCCDFINVHTYRYSSAASLEKQIKQLASDSQKPVLVSEIGIDYKSEIINADIFNQQNWIGVMTSAGCCASWYWEAVYSQSLCDMFSFISRFAAKMPFDRGVENITCTANQSTVGTMGYTADKEAWIWVYDKESIVTYTNQEPIVSLRNETQITIPYADGSYLYSVYDSASGNLLGSGTAKSENGSLTVTLPEWSKSIALEIG